MSNFDMTAAQGASKRIFAKRMTEVVYSVDRLKNNPGFASLKTGTGNKTVTPFGEAYIVPVQTGRGGSTSADIDVSEAIDADGVGSTGIFDQFLVTPAKLYTTYEVDGDVLDRIKDEGAFIQASTKIVKDATDAHVRKLCVLMHGTGAGDIGVIGSTGTAPNFIILSDPASARNIERGDRLVAADLQSSGDLRSATYLRVTSRNTVTGKIGLSADPAALGWVTGDFIFWAGTRNLAPKGYFAWCPQVEPTTGDNHFGVDRSNDPVRLGGNRFAATGITKLRDALIQASVAHTLEGGEATRVRVSGTDWAALAIEGEALPSFVASANQGDTTIGFKAMMLAGVGPVLLDESMPTGHAFIEDPADWKILSDDGDLVKIVSHDGLVFRKRAGDKWAITLKSLIQLVNDKPGRTMHVYDLGN